MTAADGKGLLRLDLHVHTRYSKDSDLSLLSVIAATQKQGLGGLAITDHNRIDGALELRQIAPFLVIVGEEIRTDAGEVIGYFLQEQVPQGLSPEETAARIREQGGLVCVPHPFDRMRRSVLARAKLLGLLPLLDMVEIYNSRTFLDRYDREAKAFAEACHLPASAGSDAHLAREIGHAYVEIPAFSTAGEFKAALARARVVGQRTSPLVHLAACWTRWRKR